MDTTLNYSPNFEVKKRKLNQIKFIIFHYTGMKKESKAIERLTNIKSNVSSHYLIKNNGEILTLVPELYIAWHAGVSFWKNYKFLIKKYKISSKNILGHADIAPERKNDPGEKFPWEYLFKNKIGIWHSLDKKKLIKNRKLKIRKTEERSFFKNLFEIGYSKKHLTSMNKAKYLRRLVKNFQRRFRQELINSKIDRECLLISEDLLKKND